ncbi:MAG: LytR/AlgR family response regulator transcription factor [Lachnospiraceae bacterium]
MEIKIAICDDEAEYREEIADIVSRWLTDRGYMYTFTSYLSGEELLQDEEKLDTYDIIFLDVIMSELNGIETAKRIRQKQCSAYLVFITSFADYAIQRYEVEAVRYILKDQLKPALEDCMHTILKKLCTQPQFLKVVVNQREIEIPLEEILYIENQKHSQRIHRTQREQTLVIRDSLDRIEKDLALHGFVRVHKSYLVNFAYVWDVKNYVVYLEDGTELPVPRSKYRQVKDYFIQQMGVQ